MDSGISLLRHVSLIIDRLKGRDILLVQWKPYLSETVASVASIHNRKCLGCEMAECLESPHMWAAIGVYRNTQKTRDFVRAWLSVCEDKNCLISPNQNNDTEPSSFMGHIHDESLLSIMAAKNKDIISTITTGEAMYSGKDSLIVWHHRHPKDAFFSLVPYYISRDKRLARFFYWGWTYLFRRLC